MLRLIRRDERTFDAAAQSALRPYAGVLAELLFARGMDTAAKAEAYLAPSMRDLYDPMLLSGMAEAVALLSQAKAEGWPVAVYGDYDADGVCAAVLATEALRLYGIDAQPHVPLRAEGYGLNMAAVESLATRYRLMLTVDLGVTNAAEVARAMALGMRVIVTDHHQPGLIPCPADAVVNPLFGGYPFPRLCGAGVAWKLAAALLGTETAAQWLDIAALATVADIVPLMGENRVLVAQGLPKIGDRPGLKALVSVAGCRLPLSAETVAYQLAPRINAAGRIADANLSVRLLLTRDPAEADRLARELDAANTERKRLEAEATADAAAQAETHDFVRRRVLFVRGEGWNTGIVGLVAGKLNHRFGAPVCALTEAEGLLHGSLRGVKGVNLAACLQTCDDLLLRYGGHEMAAGVTLPTANDGVFRERLEQAVSGSASADAFVPAQEFDLPLSFAQADDSLLDMLERMQPFGFGNPAPVFYTEGARLERRRACGAQGAHLQLTLRDGVKQLDGIAFGMGDQASRLPDVVDAAYTLARETFMGNTAVKCHVEAIRPSAAARAGLLKAEPQVAFDNALLRRLLDAVAAFPPADAGNFPSDAELMKAVSSETAGISQPAQANGSPENAAQMPAASEATPGDAGDAFGSLPFAIAPLLAGRQGTLFVAYARETALRFVTAYGDRVDLARGAPNDPRCFHTLLIQPDPMAVKGCWRTVALLDGEPAPGERAAWQAAAPDAEVLVAQPSAALAQALAALDAGDEQYRSLFKRLRGSAFGSLRETAAAADLTEAQTLAGLTAFCSLGLIGFCEAPFQYTLCEPHRCSLSDSPILGVLRARNARKEARGC